MITITMVSNEKISGKELLNDDRVREPEAVREGISVLDQSPEAVRERIRELLEAEYARIQAAADEIAPDFDYEAEASELTDSSFVWKEDEERAEKEKARQKRIEELMSKPLPPAKVSHSKYPRSPYVPKTAAGKAMLGNRHSRTLTAALLMLAMFAGYQAWDYLVPKRVDISYTTYGGVLETEYRTTSRTVGSLMEELKEPEPDGQLAAAGIEINDHDIADLGEDVQIVNDLPLGIVQTTETTAKIAGKKQDILLIPGTVQDNLDLNEIQYDDDDQIKPALDRTVDADTRIVVNEIHYVTEEKTETIEADSRVILDPSLTSGVQITDEGNDGEGIFTYTTKYVNGKDKGTERELKEWKTEPHDHVLRLGTSSTGASGTYRIARTFVANTTAYTAGSGAKGALGQSVHVGTCAVDPGFVSLRSELWVEGYGYAYANDTGGAVKGNVVDLYMSSNSQCIQWGRRNKTAYVLQRIE